MAAQHLRVTRHHHQSLGPPVRQMRSRHSAGKRTQSFWVVTNCAPDAWHLLAVSPDQSRYKGDDRQSQIMRKIATSLRSVQNFGRPMPAKAKIGCASINDGLIGQYLH